MKKGKKISIPFWLQIVAILMAGVAASGIIFLAARGNETGQKGESLQKHTVTFAYLDGTVIGTKEVESGKGVFPPELTDKGVFRGWSSAINAVTSDVEVHPVFHTITEDNLFYFDSVYVQEGKEFALDVCVGGNVSVSSGELTLSYDTDVLTFQVSEDTGICAVTQEEKGELTLRFSSAEPITQQTLLAQLRFQAKQKDAYSTEVTLRTANVKIVSGGQEGPADHATINNKIYFLQEVG